MNRSNDLGVYYGRKQSTTTLCELTTARWRFLCFVSFIVAAGTATVALSGKALGTAPLILPVTVARTRSVPRRYEAISTPPKWKKRIVTEAGVDVSDPQLYQAVNYDDRSATVMGMASGYGLDVYKRFVGSLRKSGFQGHIILGVSPNVSPDILRYFEYRNVTPKILQYVNCSFVDHSKPQTDTSDHVRQQQTCAHPYPDIKLRWSRFPLARDWLLECRECTGPALVVDVRDSLFQGNPFGPSAPVIRGLQVYEEHKNHSMAYKLFARPIEVCRGAKYYEDTMLCSGTTVGTRVAMLKYLEAMHAEMMAWMGNPKCRFGINGDDQSIHNHLYYSGQLPFATAIANQGGIVNTVGSQGGAIRRQHPKGPFEGANNENRWIGGDLINDEGLFVNFDGKPSLVVHQFDRFGNNYNRWLLQQDFAKDDVPPDWSTSS